MAAAFAEFKMHGPNAMISPVNNFGADKAVGLSEIEDEVIELSLMSHGSGEGFLEMIAGDPGADDNEGIDPEGFFKRSVFDAVFFSFENPDVLIINQGEAQGFAFLVISQVESGVRTESGEEKIAHGVIVSGHQNIARFEEALHGFLDALMGALFRLAQLYEGLFHVGDGAATESKEMEHHLAISRGGTPRERVDPIGHDSCPD